jgi:hypothetical protein
VAERTVETDGSEVFEGGMMGGANLDSSFGPSV